jgi:hypothetical protein
MKTCPKCQAQHEKSGKFCSVSCANSRTWSEEDKRKKSIGGRKFYQTEAGQLNRWVKGQRNSRKGFRPLSDPEVKEKVEDDYFIPYDFNPDNSKFISDGDVWFVDE